MHVESKKHENYEIPYFFKTSMFKTSNGGSVCSGSKKSKFVRKHQTKQMLHFSTLIIKKHHYKYYSIFLFNFLITK